MNKKEAIELINNIDTLSINDIIKGQQVDMVIKNQVLDIINQIDEDKPLKEPLGVLLVDMPKPSNRKYSYLIKYSSGNYDVLHTDNSNSVIGRNSDIGSVVKLTEAEAKEKYPNFRWVSLEELENEG